MAGPPWRPRPAQLGTGALVVAALALGQLLNDRLPDGTDGSRLFERDGAVGEVVALRTGDLTVTGVDGATSVLRELDASIRSPGLVLVVRFEFVARDEASGISYAHLVGGDGRETTFSSFGSRNDLDCPAGPPGLVSSCVAVVEVDPESLPGARLGLSADSLDPRFDDMAVIDLGIGAADVRRWSSVKELPVDAARLGGR
jgi:hypothetical protein